MTNAEAKEIVKRIKGYMGDGECWSESEFMAMDKAIKALESLEDVEVIGYKLVDDKTDNMRTAHLFGTVGGCYTSNSTDVR